MRMKQVPLKKNLFFKNALQLRTWDDNAKDPGNGNTFAGALSAFGQRSTCFGYR